MALKAVFRIYLMTVSMLMLLTACSADQDIRISGRIDGMGTGNLKLVFFSRDAMQSIAATAIDGKFMMTGRIDRPALVRIYSNTGAVVGRLAIKPGETVDINLNLQEPWKMEAEGNSDSEYLAQFLKDNAQAIEKSDKRALNEAVEQYVRKYPRRGVSAILLTDFYSARGNESKVAELLELLDREAYRLASASALEMMVEEQTTPVDSLHLESLELFGLNDSVNTVRVSDAVATVVVINDGNSRLADSVISSLSRLRGYYQPMGGAQIIDIGVDDDTVSWHRNIDMARQRMPIGVKHFWALSPRHIKGLEAFAPARVPWFVVADSTGKVIHNSALLPK